MKKSLLLTLAALAMIFTQCKKAENVVPQGGTTQGGETIEISLNINKNSKVIVDPGSTVASVTFQTGDVIHVASDGKYSGTLTCDGGIFKGTIVKPSKGSTMYFYFLGNKPATDADGNALSTTTGYESTTMMVNISDQSSALPVISYGTATYNETTTEYSATLRNQCGLVKFNVSGYNGSGNVILTGMNNKVDISLSSNTFTYGKMTTRGDVKLYEKTSEKDVEYWAILLPQDAVNTVCDGEVFTSEGHYTGTHTGIPTIEANGYITGDDAVTITLSDYVDFGLPSGHKWAKFNVGAETTWEYGDYFAWGETTPYNQVPSAYPSGWDDVKKNSDYLSLITNNTAKTDYSWTYYKWGTSDSNLFKYTGSDSYGTTLKASDDAAIANWGDSWHMPTSAGWKELYDNTTSAWTFQNGVYGIKFTGKASGYTDKSIFLPAAGYRYGASPFNAGSIGYYWSSSLHSSYPYYAYSLNFDSGYVILQNATLRYGGCPVRPVQ